MVDAVLAFAEAVRGTGSPQSSEFSLLLAECLMSTLRTFDEKLLLGASYPLHGFTMLKLP